MSEARSLAVAAIEGEGPAAPLGPALRALLTGGDRARDDALELLGVPTWEAARFARAQRDAWLGEAARLAAPGARPWARARALLRLAVEAGRDCGRLSPGDLLAKRGPAAVALQRAARWGAIPGTVRRLYDALGRADPEPEAASAVRGVSSPHDQPQREAA